MWLLWVNIKNSQLTTVKAECLKAVAKAVALAPEALLYTQDTDGVVLYQWTLKAVLPHAAENWYSSHVRNIVRAIFQAMLGTPELWADSLELFSFVSGMLAEFVSVGSSNRALVGRAPSPNATESVACALVLVDAQLQCMQSQGASYAMFFSQSYVDALVKVMGELYETVERLEKISQMPWALNLVYELISQCIEHCLGLARVPDDGVLLAAKWAKHSTRLSIESSLSVMPSLYMALAPFTLRKQWKQAGREVLDATASIDIHDETYILARRYLSACIDGASSGTLSSFSDPALERTAESIRSSLERASLDAAASELQTQKGVQAMFANTAFAHVVTANDLATAFENLFDLQEPANKLVLVRRLGRLGCCLGGRYVANIDRCGVCDIARPNISDERPVFERLSAIFTSIVSSTDFHRTNDLRVATCIALRRMVMSFTPDFKLDHNTTLGAWIMSCLRSTTREIRVLAASLLPCFILVRPASESSVNEIFKCLTDISFERDSYLCETTLSAWRQVACVSEGEQLNFVLMKLIDHLGSKNSFESSVAAHELRAIAKHKRRTMWQLCTPFWPTLSVRVLKQLNDNRQLVIQFATLLEIRWEDFVRRHLPFTVPYLALSRRFDVVASIAEICQTSPRRIYASHIPVILAVLMTQDVTDPLRFAEQRWNEADPSFKDIDLATIIGVNIAELTFEILKLSESEDVQISHHSGTEALTRAKNIRIKNALHHMSMVKYGENATMEQLFNDSLVLQLVAQFSDTVRNIRGKQSYMVKVQCLRGISMMIRCAPVSFLSAVPQICAFLLSALDSDSLLQAEALAAWFVMVSHLEKEITSVLNLTFSVIVQKWEQLESNGKASAISILKLILFNKGRLIMSWLKSHGAPSLSRVPELQEFESLLNQMEGAKVPFLRLRNLVARVRDDNVYVVRQALTELREFLLTNHEQLLSEAHREKNLRHVRTTLRTLFNAMYAYHGYDDDIGLLCSQCLGLFGALDHHKFDITPENDMAILINNFFEARESISFVVLFIENYLVKAFRASTDPSSQMFSAFGIQEYLKFCGLGDFDPNASTGREVWDAFSRESKAILLPLLNSRYSAPAAPQIERKYPIFSTTIPFREWLRAFSYDLMSKVSGENAEKIFGVCRKIVRDKEQYHEIFSFVLPYVALNVVAGENSEHRQNVLDEMLAVISATSKEGDDLSPFHRSVFAIVDYFTQWVAARSLTLSKNRSVIPSRDDTPIRQVNGLLSKISPLQMAMRSFECKSFPRAIMFFEAHLRSAENLPAEEVDNTYHTLQNIYASIDDPDALEGVSSKLPTLSLEQQILQYENAGQWDYAMECYEVLEKRHEHWDIPQQTKMMNCLQQCGRYDELLARLEAVKRPVSDQLVGLGVEVSWMSEQWDRLQEWLSTASKSTYEVQLGLALLALKHGKLETVARHINEARTIVSQELSSTFTTSLSQCSQGLLHLHALADLESIASLAEFADVSGLPTQEQHQSVSSKLDERLDMAGLAYQSRRYLLALRRSSISISPVKFSEDEAGVTWVATARDARKQRQYHLSLQSSFHALACKSPKAYVEYAKLLWDQGEQRKAVTALESVLDPAFLGKGSLDHAVGRDEAKIALLHTSWLGDSGQLDSAEVLARYKTIVKLEPKWEKAHYKLAKFCNKIYDSQLALPEESRAQQFLDGSYVRLLVQYYSRSITYGVKYAYETLPKMITLWLDFAATATKVDKKTDGNTVKLAAARKEAVAQMNQIMKRTTSRVPAYVFYLSLPQILSRIVHTNVEVYPVLEHIILEVVRGYPKQSLWPLFGVVYSKQRERSDRGRDIVNRLRVVQDGGSKSLFGILSGGLKLAEALMGLCNASVNDLRKVTISLSRDLAFDRSVVPCELALPIQSMMDVTLPSKPEALKNHVPFANPDVHIVTIDDSATIQSSLQKPKKITMWGSNGLSYNILCKPHDDCRKDARLIDFTSTIDKLLKKNSQASTRHLGIATYHVTPLNEDCGLIEWVDGALPMRSVILKLYQSKGIAVKWQEARAMLSVQDEKEGVQNFLKLQKTYKPVLWEWFRDTFPDPNVWLANRTRFARTTAVMSMVGYILG